MMGEREQSKLWHNVQIYTTARRTWSCCGPSAYTILNISFHQRMEYHLFSYRYACEVPLRIYPES